MTAFSYGSGYGAELFTIEAGPLAAEGAWASDVKRDLDRRDAVDLTGYESLRGHARAGRGRRSPLNSSLGQLQNQSLSWTGSGFVYAFIIAAKSTFHSPSSLTSGKVAKPPPSTKRTRAVPSSMRSPDAPPSAIT